jgi:hypothetical protein
VDSVPNTNVVLDASTFLAQDQPQADMVENMQEKDVNDDVNTVKTMSAEEDLVVINVLNVSGKQGGNTGGKAKRLRLQLRHQSQKRNW